MTTISSACIYKLHSLRNTMCDCHQQCIQTATKIIDAARNANTTSNVQLVQMICDGLQFKEMVAGVEECFSDVDRSNPTYQKFAMFRGMMTGMDAGRAALMINSIDVKSLLDMVKDLLTTFSANQFCQNSCSA